MKEFQKCHKNLLSVLLHGKFWCSYPPRDKHDLLWGGNVTDGDMCHITSILRIFKARDGLAHFVSPDFAVLQAADVIEPSSVCFHQCL